MGVPRRRRVAGRFDIEGEAGVGAGGTVYCARDLATGAPVALKLLHTPAGEGAERFEREATTLAKLAHPSVVRYVDHGVTEGEPFLAMEWLEGRDLRQQLSEDGLGISQTVALGAAVAGALAAVHALGVLHRDVKPSNIFLVAPVDGGPWTPGSAGENVKLVDFGLVRFDDASSTLTRGGVTLGTPGYMAPEQARGDLEIGPPADLFSLGCVLFRCLTGHPPFEGNQLVAVLTKVLVAEAPRVRSLRSEVPEALDALVARLLEKDPARRPAGAAEVADALVAIAADIPAPAMGRPDPTPARTAGLSEREQLVAAVLLAGPPPAGDADHDGGDPRDPASHHAIGAANASLRAAVSRCGARLDRLVGGTRVITMAASASALDQAVCLARCALEVRAAVPQVALALATGWSTSSGPTLAGEAIDRAAGLLSHPAARSGVALDEVTADLLDAQFDVAGGDAGPRLLAGSRDAPLAARTLLGRAVPYLGRDWELSTVAAELLQSIAEPRAAALVFTAPPGAGKSRLAMEAALAERSRHPGLEVWVGRGEAGRGGAPFGLLAQVIRSACKVPRDEPPEQQRRRLSDGVAAHVPAPERDRITDHFAEVAGIASPGDPGPALRAARADPLLGLEQIRQAFVDFLAACTAAQPVLIVADDLQWADGPSLRLVEWALDELARAPWMVLGLGRPELDERFPQLWADRGAQRLRLRRLARMPAERLVRSALGDDADVSVVARLVDLADGNVFFLEELIRAVARRHAVDRAPAPASREPVPLPQTVVGVVQARLEGLDGRARRMLRAASVFGEAFWPGAVTALLGGSSTPPDDWIDPLVAAELVVRRPESRFAGEPELAFRNAVLREGAYAMLTEEDRAAGHLLAGAWLAEHGERDALVIAHHFERGGAPGRAAVPMLRAAEQALRAADLTVAVSRADRAIALGLPEPARIHALGVRCEAQTWSAEWDAAAATAAEVLARARPGSAPWARAAVARQSHALLGGRREELMEVLAAVWGAEPEPDAVGTVLYAVTSGTFFLCLGCRFVTASRLLDRVDELSARLPVDDAANQGRTHLCHAMVDALGSGDPDRAVRRAEAARACYQRATDPAHLAFAQLFLGIAEWNLGRLDEARRAMTAIAATGPRAALTASVRDVYEALVLIDAGALDAARDVADRAERAALRVPSSMADAKQRDAHWIRAEAALRAGDLPAAEREARAALERARGSMLSTLAIEVLLAEVLVNAGRGVEALALARAPMAALEDQGGRGFRAARTRLVAARALDAAGQPGEARRVLAVARAEISGRAARIGDPDLRRGFLERVPEHARTLSLAAERLDADPGQGPV